jgi:hypothetical protein
MRKSNEGSPILGPFPKTKSFAWCAVHQYLRDLTRCEGVAVRWSCSRANITSCGKRRVGTSDHRRSFFVVAIPVGGRRASPLVSWTRSLFSVAKNRMRTGAGGTVSNRHLRDGAPAHCRGYATPAQDWWNNAGPRYCIELFRVNLTPTKFISPRMSVKRGENISFGNLHVLVV